jgi:hypothetical protein
MDLERQRREAEDIYQCWEVNLKAKMIELDYMVRQVFHEMSVFGVRKEISEALMQKKFVELLKRVAGGETQ